jgi:proline iminopeptidase
MRYSAFSPALLFLLMSFATTAAQDRAEALPRTSGLIEINGTLHPYLLEGQGVPCVLVGPAFFFSQFYSDELKRHIQFLLVDFKNTWMAEPSADLSQVTMASLVAEIDQVRRAFGYERICVVGNSVLGFWALEYARAFPDHISHAVVIGTPPVWTSADTGEYEAIVNEYFDLHGSEEREAKLYENWKRFPEEMLEGLSPWDRFVREQVNRAPLKWYDFTYDPFRHFAGRQNYFAMAEHIFGEVLTDYDPRQHFAEIEAPVFLALGRYDFTVPYIMWEGEKDRFPNLFYHLFERSGHFPMLEEHELFDQALIEFLGGGF